MGIELIKKEVFNMTKVEILRNGFGESGYQGPNFNTIIETKEIGKPLEITERMLEYFRKAQEESSILELLDGKAKSEDEGDGCRIHTEFSAKLGVGNKWGKHDSRWRMNTDICAAGGISQTVSIGIKECAGCEKPGEKLKLLNKLRSWGYSDKTHIQELLLMSNNILGSAHDTNVESVSKIKNGLYEKKNQLMDSINETCKKCEYVQEILKSVQFNVK